VSLWWFVLARGAAARIGAVIIDDGVDEPVIDGHADEALRAHPRQRRALTPSA
jgi:hypothetical protein